MSDPVGDAPHFAVLGPLRAQIGATELNLGPLQQRVVLAVLLVHANLRVGRDQLIDAVWSKPPTYAVNLVQKHISGLRRIIEPARHEGHPRLLTWSDAGYRLAVPAGSLDLMEVDRLLGEARSARAAGDVRRAARALHAVMSLWRGPAFDGLSSPLLDAERDRLADRRIGVLEERIDVDLVVGDSADLVPELHRLVSEHPLRERLRELLMLALYRSGRQAEALGAFQQARLYLREELGVDPGPSLVMLHQRILGADPGLVGGTEDTGVRQDWTEPQPGTLHHATPPPATADQQVMLPVPAQLPRAMRDFVGRDAIVDRLDGLLGPGSAGDRTVDVVAISGTAGVGKTALAVHWAHRVRERFPDGQLYVNLRGFDPTGSAIDPAEAIRAFLDGLGVSARWMRGSPESQAALYRSLLADRRVLILLDNARDADQVRPLLPGGSGCLVLVTSRDELPGLVAVDGAQPVAVDLLSLAEARQLLSSRLGATRTAAEPAAVDDIIASCARLPLALTVAAARAALHPTFSLNLLALDLRAARSRLDAFDDGDASTDVRAVFSWSYQALSPRAADLFRLLGLHPGPDMSVSAAASLAGQPMPATRRLLGELARAHLVTERLPGRFAFHDLLRAYAAELAEVHDSRPQRQAAQRRMLDHYLHTAKRAHELLNPHHDNPSPLLDPGPDVTVDQPAGRDEALAWFHEERPVLLAMLRHAGELDDVLTGQLVCSLGPFLEYQGYWREWRVALEASRRHGDKGHRACILRQLGRANIRLGHLAESDRVLHEALALYTELGDRIGQGYTHHVLCWQFDRQRRYADGLAQAVRSLELFQAAGHRSGEGRARNAVGWFKLLLGDYQQALADITAALELQRDIDDRYGQAETLDSLGYIHRQLGNSREAVACYERALALYRGFGDRYNEADSLVYLGDALLAAGERQAAAAAWGRALVIFERLHHPDVDIVRAKIASVQNDDLATAPVMLLPAG